MFSITFTSRSTWIVKIQKKTFKTVALIVFWSLMELHSNTLQKRQHNNFSTWLLDYQQSYARVCLLLRKLKQQFQSSSMATGECLVSVMVETMLLSSNQHTQELVYMVKRESRQLQQAISQFRNSVISTLYFFGMADQRTKEVHFFLSLSFTEEQ